VYLNQRHAEFSFSTPSAPPLTYTFKLIRSWKGLPSKKRSFSHDSGSALPT